MPTEQPYIHHIRERIQAMYDDPASRILFWTVADSIPANMKGNNQFIPAPLLEDDDWAVWKPVPSTITKAQIDLLEQQYEFQFPLPYRAFLQAYHLLDWQLPNLPTTDGYPGGCSSFMFPSLDTEQGLCALEQLIQQWPIFQHTGYIPFAIGEDGQGIVCFDTVRKQPDGDCPVSWMMIDTLYELPDASAAEDRRAMLEPKMEDIFSSFDALLGAVFRKRA
ncbi:SMI1/KNR4 family protein [Paenibacillus wenxiniae]|uniref:SMI1/KNR4 family protein n=1 Tax=Paenibacillus wenxiniae TaxID=1636843 RepID=A0ABW4RQZ4_9BACL